jgi:hypothetical protein
METGQKYTGVSPTRSATSTTIDASAPGMSPLSRYCCKSPKLPGANFLAVKKSDRRPPIDVAPIALPIEKTAMIRVRAGISYALTEAMDEGHCGLPTDELVSLAEKLLEVTQELIRAGGLPFHHPESPSGDFIKDCIAFVT